MEPTEPNRTRWLTVKQKNVADISEWKTKAFEPAFHKLAKGLRIWYATRDRSPSDAKL